LLPEQKGAIMAAAGLSTREYGGHVVVALDGELDVVDAGSVMAVLAAAAAKLVKALRKEGTLHRYAAKDILRAAGLPLLGPADSEVSADLVFCP